MKKVCGLLLGIVLIVFCTGLSMAGPSDNGQTVDGIDHNGNGTRLETSVGMVEIVPVMIGGKRYYRIIGNADEAAMIKSVRQTVERYDSKLPKPLRSDSGIVSRIVTEAEETRLLEAAREAQKLADKSPQKSMGTLGTRARRACSCCGGTYYVPGDKQCNRVCSCGPGTDERIKQKIINKKFRQWKYSHCSPLPTRDMCRDVCKMNELDQKTEKGRMGWFVISNFNCND